MFKCTYWYQILNHRPYEDMLRVVDKIIKKSNHKFQYIDLGGGMGIDYNHDNSKLDLKKYSKNIEKFLKNDCQIIFEPGRSIVGNSAILITKIIYIKEGYKKDCCLVFTIDDLIDIHFILLIINFTLKKQEDFKKSYEFVDQFVKAQILLQLLKNIKNYMKKTFGHM